MATLGLFRRLNRRARRVAAFWLLASLIFGSLLAGAAYTGRLASLNQTLSNYLYVRPGAVPPGNVVIVAMDDKTLDARPTSELGTLRLPKADYARVISAVRSAGAAAIGVDIILSESSDPADVAALQDVLAAVDDTVLAARPGDSAIAALLPLKALGASRIGSVLFAPNIDGVVRRERLMFSDENVRLAFPLAVLDAYFAQPSNPDRREGEE